MTGKTYVIGAGLAGLSAATILAERGASVTLIDVRAGLPERPPTLLDVHPLTSSVHRVVQRRLPPVEVAIVAVRQVSPPKS